jgi:hypothetical protein
MQTLLRTLMIDVQRLTKVKGNMRIHVTLELFTDPFYAFIYYWKNLQWRFEYTCMPLLFKFNCVGCSGCGSNQKPFLATEFEHKGPYKVVVTETFCNQYENLCGKTALVDLLFDLEKHNDLCNSQKEIKK